MVVGWDGMQGQILKSVYLREGRVKGKWTDRTDRQINRGTYINTDRQYGTDGTYKRLAFISYAIIQYMHICWLGKSRWAYDTWKVGCHVVV